MISVHPETTYHLHRTLNHIRHEGCRAGVVLNPATPLAMIEEVLDEIDYVLLMSVNPGFGGQKFIPSSLDKLRRLREMMRTRGMSVKIEIDGGIGPDNVGQVVAAGAEILVAGSAVFGKPDPAEALRDLLRAASNPSLAGASV
jgi:ribulose-phosphate 3-epimerase